MPGHCCTLAEQWDVPIYAHELEAPYLNGTASYPPPDPTVGGGLMSLLSRFYPRGPVDVSRWLHLLPGDGSVPPMPGWKWIAVPGHTPGQVAFSRIGPFAHSSGRVRNHGEKSQLTRSQSRSRSFMVRRCTTPRTGVARANPCDDWRAGTGSCNHRARPANARGCISQRPSHARRPVRRVGRAGAWPVRGIALRPSLMERIPVEVGKPVYFWRKTIRPLLRS